METITIFEKEREGIVELTKLDKEEFRRRFRPFRNMLARRMFLELFEYSRQGFVLGTRRNMDSFYYRIRPIIENPINKRISHICSITDILDD